MKKRLATPASGPGHRQGPGDRQDRQRNRPAGRAEARYRGRPHEHRRAIAARRRPVGPAISRSRREGRELRLSGQSRWPTAARRPALEELIRWRLWNRTGGGLMAELGSHQLDAAGIFISGLRQDGQKALPLSVSARRRPDAVPARPRLRGPRLLLVRVPRPRSTKSDPNKKIGVTYSSINGNGFGGYGETVMGTKGTLILEREQEVMLFSNSAPATTAVSVSTKGQGGPDARHHAERRRRGGRDRQEGPRRPGQPRLHRRARALGLVHPQSRPRARRPAAIRKWPWATP